MPKNPLLPVLNAVVLLIALLALLIAYYWVHKPVDAGALMRLSGLLIDTATTILLFMGGGVLGRAALQRALRVRWHNVMVAERVTLETVLGVGIISTTGLIAGLFGVLNVPILWIALGIAVVLLRRDGLGWLADVRTLARSIRVESPFGALMGAALAVMLGMAGLIALAPPYAWDSQTYHLIAPERYLAQGAVRAHADNFFLGFPQWVEMLFTLTVGLFGRMTAAAPVHFLLGLCGLVSTMAIVRRAAGARAGLYAVLILLSAYSLWRLFGWAYVDLGVMALCAAAWNAILIWRQIDGQPAHWLILAGVMLGFAVGAKYIAGVWAVALFVLVVMRSPRRRVIAHALWLTLPALIAFAPYLIKGAVLYGNPIYPYLIGGLEWDAARNAAFNLESGGLVPSGRAWHLPILPLAAAVLGIHNGEGYSFTSGLWLLTGPFLLIFAWRGFDQAQKTFIHDALILLASVWIGWGALAAFNGIAAQTRMIVMAFPLFATLGALALSGLESLPRKPLDVGFIVRGLFAFTILFGVIDTVREFSTQRTAAYALGLIDERDYLYTQMGAHHPALVDLADHVPAGAVVRLMWEPRSLYCPPVITCRPDVLFDHWRRAMRDHTPVQALESFRTAGDTHLLVWSSGQALDSAAPDHAAINAQFMPAIERAMIPVWTDGLYYTLYAWH